jgi:hypothetical protein
MEGVGGSGGCSTPRRGVAGQSPAVGVAEDLRRACACVASIARSKSGAWGRLPPLNSYSNLILPYIDKISQDKALYEEFVVTRILDILVDEYANPDNKGAG